VIASALERASIEKSGTAQDPEALIHELYEAASPGFTSGPMRRGLPSPEIEVYGRGMDGLDTPNCEVCLARLWPAGSDEHPYWWCPSCKVARLS